MELNKQAGFTLIELMIVVAIMGIIATIAMNTYSNNVISAKRTDARSSLQNTATTLDKCKATYGSYNHANCSIASGDSNASTEGLYSIAVISTAATFTLTATPSAGSSQANDTECTSLILDNLGRQTGTGTDSTVCW